MSFEPNPIIFPSYSGFDFADKSLILARHDYIDGIPVLDVNDNVECGSASLNYMLYILVILFIIIVALTVVFDDIDEDKIYHVYG